VKTLAGLITIRNGNALDYSWRESARSLLAVCDELVIGDVMSEDGTWDEVQAWAAREPRITLVRTEWTDPKGDVDWWPRVLNRTREHAKSQHILHLDADEVIHEDDHELIRRAADNGTTCFLHRYNFWRNPQSLIPEGVCCGTKVLRMAPANMPIPSDYPYEPAAEAMKMAVESIIRVYHYGFLRRREAFFRKAREVQRIWCNSFDPRLESAEKFEGVWSAMPGVTGWEDKLVPFIGSHPKVIHQWLKDRAFTI
jgi:glycosyltransferase involved in cell wall biosynthesis